MSMWIPADEVPEGEGRCFDVNGEHVAVVNIDGRYFAMSGDCPTATAGCRTRTLRQVIDGCPRREWRFDPMSGACSFHPEVVGELRQVETQGRWWEGRASEVEVEVRGMMTGDVPS